MKITHKIGLSFLIVGFLITLLGMAIFYEIVRDSLSKAIENNLSGIVVSRADHIKTYLQMLKTSVAQLSESDTLKDFLEISNEEDPRYRERFERALARVRRTREANSALAEFLLMDHTGRIVLASGKSKVGGDLSTDAFFLSGKKEVYIKDVYYSESDGEPLMAVSAPLLDAQTGKLLGVLAAKVKLNKLNNIVADRTGLSETGEIYIVNKYGYMITPSRFLKNTVLKQQVKNYNLWNNGAAHKSKESILSLHERVLAYRDYLGRQDLAVHAFIPEMQWIVLAEIETTEAFAPLFKLRLVFLLILCVIALVAWILGRRIGNFIASPLQQLTKGVEIAGTGDLDHLVGIDSNDEVGQLSRAFDSMTTHLKVSTTSIKNLQKEITQRKQAEKTLAKAKQDWEDSFDSINDAITVHDLDFNILQANKAATTLLGSSINELLRNKCFVFFHGKECPPEGCPSCKALKTGIPTAIELFEPHLNKFVEITATPRFDDGHNIIGLVHIVRDITERKRIEEEKARLFTIIEESKDFIGVADLQGNLLYHNPAAKKMVGLPEDADLSHMKIRDMHPGWAAKLIEKEGIPTALREGSWSSENALLHRNGSEVPVSQVILLHRDPSSGKPAFLSTIMRDITENKRLTEALKKSYENLEAQVQERTAELARSFQKLQVVDEELQRASRAKSEFLANMSHELRTPLNSIIGFSEVLYDERFGPLNERQKKYTANVMTSGRHLLSLINEVLDLSKVEAGKMVLDLASFSILGCMEEVLQLMESQALLKKIKSVLEVPEDLDEIHGDERKIKQVIYNLLSNAIKFTPAGGKVGIRGRRIDDGIEVTVWDTGIGIPPEDLEKAFGAFERLGNLYTQETEGTGLGLTISRKMVELHGGKIWIESEGVGKGTAVKFTIPSGGGG